MEPAYGPKSGSTSIVFYAAGLYASSTITVSYFLWYCYLVLIHRIQCKFGSATIVPATFINGSVQCVTPPIATVNPQAPQVGETNVNVYVSLDGSFYSSPGVIFIYYGMDF